MVRKQARRSSEGARFGARPLRTALMLAILAGPAHALLEIGSATLEPGHTGFPASGHQSAWAVPNDTAAAAWFRLACGGWNVSPDAAGASARRSPSGTLLSSAMPWSWPNEGVWVAAPPRPAARPAYLLVYDPPLERAVRRAPSRDWPDHRDRRNLHAARGPGYSEAILARAVPAMGTGATLRDPDALALWSSFLCDEANGTAAWAGSNDLPAAMAMIGETDPDAGPTTGPGRQQAAGSSPFAGPGFASGPGGSAAPETVLIVPVGFGVPLPPNQTFEPGPNPGGGGGGGGGGPGSPPGGPPGNPPYGPGAPAGQAPAPVPLPAPLALLLTACAGLFLGRAHLRRRG